MDWQPIDTAPRDGTRVLLWYPAWIQHVFTAEFEHGNWQTGVWYSNRAKPTHWMLLPSPPESP